jgi:hypothetical protein
MTTPREEDGQWMPEIMPVPMHTVGRLLFQTLATFPIGALIQPDGRHCEVEARMIRTVDQTGLTLMVELSDPEDGARAYMLHLTEVAELLVQTAYGVRADQIETEKVRIDRPAMTTPGSDSVLHADN